MRGCPALTLTLDPLPSRPVKGEGNESLRRPRFEKPQRFQNRTAKSTQNERDNNGSCGAPLSAALLHFFQERFDLFLFLAVAGPVALAQKFLSALEVL